MSFLLPFLPSLLPFLSRHRQSSIPAELPFIALRIYSLRYPPTIPHFRLFCDEEENRHPFSQYFWHPIHTAHKTSWHIFQIPPVSCLSSRLYFLPEMACHHSPPGKAITFFENLAQIQATFSRHIVTLASTLRTHNKYLYYHGYYPLWLLWSTLTNKTLGHYKVETMSYLSLYPSIQHNIQPSEVNTYIC